MSFSSLSLTRLPDPDDRSVNEPVIVITTSSILTIFNNEDPHAEADIITDNIITWFEERAYDSGWADVQVYGKQCVMIAKVRRG